MKRNQPVAAMRPAGFTSKGNTFYSHNDSKSLYELDYEFEILMNN